MRAFFGTTPMMLSKLWFSIITTTMCSIWGIVGVPSGRLGSGSVPGPFTFRPLTTGRAHAGRPGLSAAAMPMLAPAADLIAVRRVIRTLSCMTRETS